MDLQNVNAWAQNQPTSRTWLHNLNTSAAPLCINNDVKMLHKPWLSEEAVAASATAKKGCTHPWNGLPYSWEMCETSRCPLEYLSPYLQSTPPHIALRRLTCIFSWLAQRRPVWSCHLRDHLLDMPPSHKAPPAVPHPCSTCIGKVKSRRSSSTHLSTLLLHCRCNSPFGRGQLRPLSITVRCFGPPAQDHGPLTAG
jgi:hypothetical protein